MAKNKDQYVCQACGSVYPKWAGRCENCGEWNSLVQEVAENSSPKGLGNAKGRTIPFTGLKGERKKEPRIISGMSEFDRVCGGGLVPGSAVLIGGDPGIGKSTLLLQAMAALAKKDVKVAYISGEEAIEQIRMRARRLNLDDAPVELATATSVRDIVTTLDHPEAPQIVTIDSIQTMYLDTIDSAPGTVSQVRACTQELIRLAKRRNITLMIVGHVTKEGQIAGPRVLEHMVDTVLYFEGERGVQFRILRGVKNRFGATDEIGVFQMTDMGLGEVHNPSALFLGHHDEAVSGSAVFAGMEGTRPVLVEIQALVAPTSFGQPRRSVIGWDPGRLSMVVAVLDARCGLNLSGSDIYLNVAGGFRVSEPAADLAVAAALVSSISDTPVTEETVIFGEIGLSGEVRQVSHSDGRLKEAAKLGFTKAILPSNPNLKNKAQIEAQTIGRLYELVEKFAIDGADY